jgi:signal transduction histidine kinase
MSVLFFRSLMTLKEIPAHRRISIRLAKIGVGAAFVLGLFLGAVQVWLDYAKEKSVIADNVEHTLRVAKHSAVPAAWRMDEKLSHGIVQGLLDHAFIVKAEIISDLGDVLAVAQIESPPSSTLWITRLIAQPHSIHRLILSDKPGSDPGYGEIIVTVNRDTALQGFYRRSFFMLISGLVRNIILAVVLVFVFYFILTRPLLDLIEGFRRIDPHKPDRTTLPCPSKMVKDELGVLADTLRNYLDVSGEHLKERSKAEEALQVSEAYIKQINVVLEKRVRDRTAELAVANKELESFSYTVSHDLRSPLRAISGFSDILVMESSDKLNDEEKGYLKNIQDSSIEMSNLIDGLLTLSRSTQGTVTRDEVDISLIVENIINTHQKVDPDRIVTWDIMKDLSVTGDYRLIKTLLDNLLGNAWKYTSTTQNAHIKFGARKNAEETVYFVQDNGAGFDMAYAKQLFTPFKRLHKSAEFEGTGIGLATVQRIIHRHGGRVWAEAEVNKGAVFFFTLANSDDIAEIT